MAVVNWSYQFTMIDIGDTGRQNDGGVFVASNIGQALDEELLNIPPQGAYTLILNRMQEHLLKKRNKLRIIGFHDQEEL